MQKVKLYTASGEFVTEVLIPPFQKMPECIAWGMRTFYPRRDCDGLYYEGLMVLAMTEEEHKKLGLGESILLKPEDGHTIGSLITELGMRGQLHGFEHKVLMPFPEPRRVGGCEYLPPVNDPDFQDPARLKLKVLGE